MKRPIEVSRLVVKPVTPTVGRWVEVLSSRRYVTKHIEARIEVATVALNEVYSQGKRAGRQPPPARNCADTCDELSECGRCVGS